MKLHLNLTHSGKLPSRGKIAAALCATFLAALISGCGGSGTQQSAAPSGETASPAPTEVSSPAPSGDASSLSYRIETAEFNQDDIHVRYPQIQYPDGNAGEAAINELIKNDILDSQVRDFLQSDEDEVHLDLDLDYEVTLSTEALLSVKYTGGSYIEGGAHPNSVFYAVTIDLTSGRRLYLTDFTEIDEDFISEVKQSLSGESMQVQFDNSEGLESLISDIRSQNDTDLMYTLRYDSESDFYLTPQSLFIRLYVYHAAGDYALVQLPGTYTADLNHTYDKYLCLDAENPLITFRTEKSGKIVSICQAKDGGYLVYRFGTKDNIELEYPADKDHSRDSFIYSYSNGTDTDKARDSLIFENKGYRYEVYQESDAVALKTVFGVEVTELSSGKKTDIPGAAGSLMGYWYELRYHAEMNNSAA
ncbi:PdaC/SigV domain-containing protein [Papillibacter cinnamivorans]|uniref:Uncharacterized protein n=1 Tax=Papillibacter cinnamivorans DSM 12816 TaxID=1122930 RepID=A0A1W2C3P1_9FIRM|nr:DUF4163 domain-containing protein [Papillibacter cinnamivorans]SMC79845.1 protein of unknown function [Papillibacter cinnamivorans DSM 12816]